MFIFATGDGLDIIKDFNHYPDAIGLTSGLTYEQLIIS